MSNSIRKAYNSILELPSQVRTSLDEADQKKWMDAYNKTVKTEGDAESVRQAKVDAWLSVVDAPSSLAVETWGSVEVRDADGELVPIKSIENYADKFIEAGGLLHDSHSNVPVGTVWNYEVRTHPDTGQDGIVFYFNVYRDGEVFERARDDILSGRKQAVSIGAEAPRGGYKCDDRGCYVERDVTDLYELSICETPANPEAYFINVGKDIAKAKTPMEGEVIRFGIKDVYVHQDYTTCPLQKCKKVLRDSGFPDVHILDNGIVTAKSKTEYPLFKAISDLGYPFRYNIAKEQFEIIPDYGVEQAIEEALGNDWAHEDNIGHIALTRDIPKEVFMDWFDRGFIVKIGDTYCLKGDEVAKEGGAMGVSTAGATSPVYGSKPKPLMYSKRKAKKEFQDDGNTHGPISKNLHQFVHSLDGTMNVADEIYGVLFNTVYVALEEFMDYFRDFPEFTNAVDKAYESAEDIGRALRNYVYPALESIDKSNPISKRCPNGYHNKNGQCVDANGNVYQGKQQEQKQPKQEKPKKTPSSATTQSFQPEQAYEGMIGALKGIINEHYLNNLKIKSTNKEVRPGQMQFILGHKSSDEMVSLGYKSEKKIKEYFAEKGYDVRLTNGNTITYTKHNPNLDKSKIEAEAPKGYRVTAYVFGDQVQITSSHPYDNTEYHWTYSEDGGKTFVIVRDRKRVGTLSVDGNFGKVMEKLKELDKELKPRIDRT